MTEHDDKKVRNVDRKSILERLDTTLILFELVLSVIFSLLGHFLENMYLRGVGVGLIIAWATSALAYLYRKKKVENKHLKEKEGK